MYNDKTRLRDRPNEKLKNMTRSVLPSKARVSARIERRIIHRAARRQSRMQMQQMENFYFQDYDDYDSEEHLVGDAEIRHELRGMVRDRRGADKLGGFTQWATKNTQHIQSEEDKYYFIKQKIGSSVIKDHALGHFVGLEKARNPFVYRSILDFTQYYPCPWKNYQQLLSWVTKAIIIDHAGFNHFLKEISFTRGRCLDDSSDKYCWKDMSTDRRKHDEHFCPHKSLVSCVESWAKTVSRDATIYINGKERRWKFFNREAPQHPVGVCWHPVIQRSHDDRFCLNYRFISGVKEAGEVAKFFWNDYHQRDVMDPHEQSLVSFLQTKGILWDERK